jgi:hypothetical protein
MFQQSGLRGRILNRGLKKQYRTIYSYDPHTKYGVVEHKDGEDAFSKAFALQFLKMTAFGTGGRIFTYALPLSPGFLRCAFKRCSCSYSYAIDT